jgi:hypothetical protein
VRIAENRVQPPPKTSFEDSVGPIESTGIPKSGGPVVLRRFAEKEE